MKGRRCGERERGRDRQRERQTDRQTGRQADRQTERTDLIYLIYFKDHSFRPWPDLSILPCQSSLQTYTYLL